MLPVDISNAFIKWTAYLEYTTPYVPLHRSLHTNVGALAACTDKCSSYQPCNRKFGRYTWYLNLAPKSILSDPTAVCDYLMQLR